jgi:hypothetical protein
MQNETKNEKGWSIIKYFVMVPIMLLALIIMASCSVDQTEEGELPDVDVQVEEGKLPAYDVDVADVDIKTEEKTVEVPDVDIEMEETQVEVPTIEVTMPDDDNESIEKNEEEK